MSFKQDFKKALRDRPIGFKIGRGIVSEKTMEWIKSCYPHIIFCEKEGCRDNTHDHNWKVYK